MAFIAVKSEIKMLPTGSCESKINITKKIAVLLSKEKAESLSPARTQSSAAASGIAEAEYRAANVPTVAPVKKLTSQIRENTPDFDELFLAAVFCILIPPGQPMPR